MTTTTTTYRKILLIDGQYRGGMYTYSQDAASPEIARELTTIGSAHTLATGERYAIQRVERRLGGDGDWHITETSIIELL